MQPVRDIASSLAERHATDQTHITTELRRTQRHRQLLDKAEDLKLTQVVQTKLLADQISRDLDSLLQYFQGQKPEITKREFVLGLDQVITSIKRLAEVIPSELQALGQLLDKPKENYWTEERLTKVLESVQPKFPDITIPEPHKEVRIEDWEKVVTLLDKIAKKPDFEKTVVSIPEAPSFPTQITVDNLGEVVDKLDALLEREEQPEEEEAVGFSFERDAEDNLVSITEFYPSGTKTASGWNIGRVKISDDRQR